MVTGLGPDVSSPFIPSRVRENKLSYHYTNDGITYVIRPEVCSWNYYKGSLHVIQGRHRESETYQYEASGNQFWLGFQRKGQQAAPSIRLVHGRLPDPDADEPAFIDKAATESILSAIQMAILRPG